MESAMEEDCEWCHHNEGTQYNDDGDWLCDDCYSEWEAEQQAELDNE
jgi:hypothetical protein